MTSRGLDKIFQRDQRLRPAFSSSWAALELPEGELMKEYSVGLSKVRLFAQKNSTEAFYHLTPYEYLLSPQYIMLIELARAELTSHCPKSVKFQNIEQARSYATKEGARMIQSLSAKHGIVLGADRQSQIAALKALSETLGRYTAGLGLIEVLLVDPYVQDIYIDAPTSQNPVYVTLGGVDDARIAGKCITNLCIGDQDAESLISRFRYESGRAFSEALPVLETDLAYYNTRITAIGKPLSPNGYAFALRRHSQAPWTLLRLISCGSITPLAAGLISFLVDGQSTFLVAGSRGAGKSSLLGAIMLEFPKSQRILTIEDTLELPGDEMRKAGYKVQSMFVKSSTADTKEMDPNEALKVSLRLGESAIVLGEVRGQEARTLYEAMRTGTAGSSVLGTIHGNSAKAVYERVVHDMGIPSKSFNATDIVVVAGLKRPKGSQKQIRRIVQIAELRKDAPEGTFHDILAYDDGSETLAEAAPLERSERIQAIAKSWGISPSEAAGNIRLRAAYRERMVSYAKEHNKPEILSAKWVNLSNSAYWGIMEDSRSSGAESTPAGALAKWSKWFEESARYA